MEPLDTFSWRSLVDRGLAILQHEARKAEDERDGYTVSYAVDLLAYLCDVLIQPDVPEVRDLQRVLEQFVLGFPTRREDEVKYLTLGRVQDMWPALRSAQDRIPKDVYLMPLPGRNHKSVAHKRLMRAFQEFGGVSEMWRKRHELRDVTA